MKPITTQLFYILSAIGIIHASVPCDYVETDHGGICKCNATYCDFLENPVVTVDGELVIISSSKAGQRFDISKKNFSRAHLHQDNGFSKTDSDSIRSINVKIRRENTYQSILGFGGSYTGAVAYLMEQLTQELQDNIHKSFYADDGIGFNLMRISIGGSDFDLSPWSYNEFPENDLKLTNFTLDLRDALRIKQIKRLIEVSDRKKLRIKGAAWSAPPWMKTNNEWTGFGRLKRIYYATWVEYYIKWLQLMEDNGLPIWAISLGNEPLNGTFFMFFIKFMSMGWTPKSQATWLTEFLGPAIRQSKFKDLLILCNDDQRYTLPWWFRTMNETNPDVLSYLDGIAVHWYWDESVEPLFIKKAQEYLPGKIFLNTESCVGDKPWEKAGPVLGSWERSEKYARTFMQDLKYGLNGWIDWNIILDENGGPNYVKNYVDAPVIVNTTLNEIYKQPIFYTIGHFSKFIPEGSMVIETVPSNINIASIAFLCPDGSVVAVLHNSGNVEVHAEINDSVRGIVEIGLPPKSIHTIIYK